MGSKTLWAQRPPYTNSDVHIYAYDPLLLEDAFTTFVLHWREWIDVGGIPLKAGECKRVRITIEEGRGDA